jgi:hypothetical protein
MAYGMGQLFERQTNKNPQLLCRRLFLTNVNEHQAPAMQTKLHR